MSVLLFFTESCGVYDTRRLFASYQTVERGKCIKNHVDNPSGLLAFPSLPLVLQLPP